MRQDKENREEDGKDEVWKFKGSWVNDTGEKDFCVC